MVGVPGRSKGCRNCRRKKKGCDLERPHCGQCQKSKVQCEGYERDLMIVQYVPDGIDSLSIPPSNVGPSDPGTSGAQDIAPLGQNHCFISMTSDWTSDTSYISDGLNNSYEGLLSYPSFGQMALSEDTSIDLPAILVDVMAQQCHPLSPRSLADGNLQNSMLEFQLIQELWTVSYPLMFPCLDIGGLNMGYWRLAVEEMYAYEPAVKHALLAVALTDASRRADRRDWAIEAIRRYSLALTETNRSLSDPQKQTSDAVLAACKLLSLYESGGGSSNAGSSSGAQGGSNWDNHVVGECRVLRMRGPESLSQEASYLLFTDLRLMAVAYGFKKRRRIFLEDEEWQTLPFVGRTKDLRQLLVDNAVQHPGMHEDIDSLQSLLTDSVSSESRQRRYFDRATNKMIRLREELEAWFRLMQIIIPANALESIERGISASFNPLDQAFAHTMALYWTLTLSLAFSTCQLLMFAEQNPSLLSQRNQPVSPAGPLPSSPSPAPVHLLPSIQEASNEALLSALKIASSTSYFFHPSAGLFGTTAFSFPLSIAINYFAVTHNTSSPAFLELMKALSNPSSVGSVIKNFVVSGQKAINHADSVILADAEGKEDQAWFGVKGIDGEIVTF